MPVPPESVYRQEAFIEELGPAGATGNRSAKSSPFADRSGKENAGMGRDSERRLQQLEGNQAHLAMDLNSMKGMGAQMVGWRDQMETASTHLAAVLGLVERDGKAVRSELEELRAHKDQSETAITHMQALILHLQSQLGRGQPAGRPALEMGRLRDDIKRLESDNRKLEESMSGQIQLDGLGSGGDRSLSTSQVGKELQLHPSSHAPPTVQSPSTSGGGMPNTSRTLLLTNRTAPGTARAPDAHPLDIDEVLSSASEGSPSKVSSLNFDRRHTQMGAGENTARSRQPGSWHPSHARCQLWCLATGHNPAARAR
ncbi:hypothetical protein WJX84_004968 [Apatococcus fuscideae]|uniref:Uncharacterized protein n=1 Tax=Apatococcus fuscideae TaxID=2026836 RepID=A0AAW1SY91_9CHLO